MSTQYKKSSEVPTSVLCERLNQLSDAITKGRPNDHEFTMRIPAECDRDADLVMAEAARRLLAAESESDELRAYKEAAENRSMAWLANALEQYANGDVITVPAGAGTEEEFFTWLKDQCRDSSTAGAVPEDISAMIDKVRKWGVEHTGNEPSVSCFHRALDELQDAVAGAILPSAMSAVAVPDGWNIVTSENWNIPKVGQRVILFSNGVIQEESYTLDQADGEPGCSYYFWSRDDIDECPEVKVGDMWMPWPSSAAPSHSQQTDQRITEKDARDLITRYVLWSGTEYSEAMVSRFIDGWLSLEGHKLISELNSASPAHDSEQGGGE